MNLFSRRNDFGMVSIDLQAPAFGGKVRSMKTLFPLLLALLSLLPGLHGALAASSDWQAFEGARLKLTVSNEPEADGSRRGALDIDLQPGWKTYWMEPGDAGIPPTVKAMTAAGPVDAQIGFPVPKRFKDEYSTWAGYDEPVGLALTFPQSTVAPDGTISVSAFLGVCEKICIPVSTEFKLRIASQSTSETAVAAAFAALPDPASSETGEFTSAALDGDTLMLKGTLPLKKGLQDLFVGGSKGWAFGEPVMLDRADGVSHYSIPVLSRPKTSKDGTLHYTYGNASGAIAGMLSFTAQ